MLGFWGFGVLRILQTVLRKIISIGSDNKRSMVILENKYIIVYVITIFIIYLV